MAQISNATDGPAPAAMSIDVEDWFHVENLKRAIPRDTWEGASFASSATPTGCSSCSTSTTRAAPSSCWAGSPSGARDWWSGSRPRATRSPRHGYGHDLVYELSEDEFREDVRRCKALLEDLTGTPVRGYRAPSFSITDWSIPILQELGFAYDSSAFPTVAHDRYGNLPGIAAGKQVVELRARLPRGLHLVPDGGLARVSVGRRRLLSAHARTASSGAECRASCAPASPTSSTSIPGRSTPTSPASRGLPRLESRRYVGLGRRRGSSSGHCSRTSAGGPWRTCSAVAGSIQCLTRSAGSAEEN